MCGWRISQRGEMVLKLTGGAGGREEKKDKTKARASQPTARKARAQERGLQAAAAEASKGKSTVLAAWCRACGSPPLKVDSTVEPLQNL